MGKFDKEYFFVLKAQNERLPEMTPDDDTAELPYTHKAMPVGSKPFVFYNGSLDWQRANRMSPMNPPPEILFDGSDVLVKDKVREALIRYDIPNLVIQPAIYIDHKDVWHEDYWYLTFTDRLDCWDRKRSTYDSEPLDDDLPWFEVYTYSLNDEVLEAIPLLERKLFKMGGTTTGFVVVHRSFAGFFKGSGAVLVPIADYGVKYP
jgi:hypothetical protein